MSGMSKPLINDSTYLYQAPHSTQNHCVESLFSGLSSLCVQTSWRRPVWWYTLMYFIMCWPIFKTFCYQSFTWVHKLDCFLCHISLISHIFDIFTVCAGKSMWTLRLMTSSTSRPQELKFESSQLKKDWSQLVKFRCSSVQSWTKCLVSGNDLVLWLLFVETKKAPKA